MGVSVPGRRLRSEDGHGMPITDAFAPPQFDGQTVLITGGTGGIGLASARAFRILGARVTATGATEAECARASEGGDEAGISFAVLDVRDASAIERVLTGLGGLHVLVNA